MGDGDELARVTSERDAIAERFRLMSRAMNEGMWDWDIASNTAWWSDAMYTVFGLDPTSAPSFEAWTQRIHPDDRERVVAGFRAVVDNARETWADEYRYVRPDGRVLEVFDRGFVMFDDARRPIRMVGVVLDLTPNRVLERQLRHSQKMEAIGQLAGGVAHDFNNMLQAATLELDLLQETPDLPATAREHAVDIRASIDRAKALTHQLLVFSRRGAMKQQQVDLNARVVDVARMLRRVIGENISLQLELAPGALPAEVDPTMLDHVLVNLAVNARDAMRHAGTLAISTSSQQHDGPARPSGRYAVIAVRDTGPGIPPDILPRVFDPFFTTKESSGTGLGLATSHGIIEQHGGWIDVESSVGHGATFRVHLPIRDVPAIEPVAAAVTSRPRGSERILIVEDDLYVRRGLSALLESAGYQPVVAESGAAALSLWESPVGPFDLVLTDLIMPGGINGRDLANRLAERSQSLPVIFMTGHGQHLEIGAPHPILRKPVDPDALLVAIRAALDAAPRG